MARRSRRRGAGSCGEALIDVDELGSQIAEQALEKACDLLDGPVEALHYASHMAFLWEGGRPVIGHQRADAIGLAVVERLARHRELKARVLLRAIATVADEPIAERASERASALELTAGDRSPDWVRTLGSAEVIRAGRIEDPTTDDGTIVLFDLAWPCGARTGLGVFVDPRRGGVAKHILVGPSIAECVEEIEGREGERWPFAELSPAEAAAIVRAAVEATEAGDLSETGETFSSQRAFLRAQLSRIDDEAVPRNRAA